MKMGLLKMELKDQLCSLELSKKLKELGVLQESEFFHHHDPEAKLFPWRLDHWENLCIQQHENYSAFTVAELGDMLPQVILFDDSDLIFGGCKIIGGWVSLYYDEDNYAALTFEDETEANARAKMLIYLLENGLIENAE